VYASLLRKLSDGLAAAGIPYMVIRHPECDREYVERWLAEFEATMGVPYRERLREIASNANGEPEGGGPGCLT
jgi:hypothetical protein